MMISVYDGAQLLEARECRVVVLPDGRQGAIWRGLAYAIVPPGARIEIGDEAFLPADCGQASVPKSPFAVIEGNEEAYLLLAGSAVSCDSAAGALKAGGYEVLRTGRYLGEPVAGLDPDWFVRFLKKPVCGESLETILARLLQAPPARAEAGEAPTAELRARLIATELLAARAREAGLQAEIARLRIALASGDEAKAEAKVLRGALEQEQMLRAEAEAAAQQLTRDRSAPLIARPAQPAKLKDEIEAVIGILLERVHLLRDSLTVIAAEFANRRALYRVLHELQDTTQGRPANWKKLQGIDGWWERHVSNGQDDSGRAYARWHRAEGHWEVLVSHKGEQPRDVAWLGRQ